MQRQWCRGTVERTVEQNTVEGTRVSCRRLVCKTKEEVTHDYLDRFFK